jgi:hypothetical protein
MPCRSGGGGEGNSCRLGTLTRRIVELGEESRLEADPSCVKYRGSVCEEDDMRRVRKEDRSG